jgi:hypothetical protein
MEVEDVVQSELVAIGVQKTARDCRHLDVEPSVVNI